MQLSVVLIYVISILATVTLGSVVFFQNPNNKINRTFGSFILSILGWQISLFFFYQINDPQSVYWLGKINFVFAELIAVSLFFLCYYFPASRISMAKVYKFVVVLLTLFITTVTLFTPYVVAEEIILGIGERETITGFLYPFFTVFFLFFTGSGIFLLFQKLKKLTGIFRVQTQYLLLGFLLGIIFGVITNILLPVVFKVYSFQHFGLIAPLIFVSFTSYAIIKHRLLDIQLLVTRTISYSILLFILGAIFSVGLFIMGKLLTESADATHRVLYSTVTALIIAYAFQPLRNLVEKTTDKFFYKGRYDTQEVLEKFSKTLVSSYLVEKLSKSIVSEVVSETKMASCQIYIIRDDEIRHYASAGVKAPKEPLEIVELQPLLKGVRHRSILFENIPENQTKTIMRNTDTKAIFPLWTKDNFVGLLFVGDKLSGGILSEQDIKLFELFTPELSLAIQNAEAVYEISKFNQTLKEEVARATARLKAANQRLRQLDQVKDEFVSIASHELRTPLTSIRNYQWMILNNKGGTLSEKQRYYIERSYQATNRLTKLVTDMLNVSRIDSGRILIDVVKTDITQLTNEVIEELQVKIAERSIQVAHVVPQEGLPAVLADVDKVKEVIINLVYNALKFTPKEGKITISYKFDDDFLTVSVVDTGMGIAEDYLSALFTKFGFVKNSLKANHPTTDSTGLGLYISKSIIELHGGKIWAESAGLDKGATFQFTLPIYNQKLFQQLHKQYKKDKDAGLLHTTID